MLQRLIYLLLGGQEYPKLHYSHMVSSNANKFLVVGPFTGVDPQQVDLAERPVGKLMLRRCQHMRLLRRIAAMALHYATHATAWLDWTDVIWPGSQIAAHGIGSLASPTKRCPSNFNIKVQP